MGRSQVRGKHLTCKGSEGPGWECMWVRTLGYTWGLVTADFLPLQGLCRVPPASLEDFLSSGESPLEVGG